jgi:hypothetical protein
MWEPQPLATLRASTACTGRTLPYLPFIPEFCGVTEKNVKEYTITSLRTSLFQYVHHWPTWTHVKIETASIQSVLQRDEAADCDFLKCEVFISRHLKKIISKRTVSELRTCIRVLHGLILRQPSNILNESFKVHFIYLLICSLFNGAFVFSDCIASNDRMID